MVGFQKMMDKSGLFTANEEMYKKPSKANLEEFGKAWVDHLFDDFNNPKFRGPNFTWDQFPDIVVGLACANLPMSYKSNGEHEAQLEVIIRVLAAKKIENLEMTASDNQGC